MHPVEDAAVSVYSVYSNSRKLPEPSITFINCARLFRRYHTMSTFLRPLYEIYLALPVCKNNFRPGRDRLLPSTDEEWEIVRRNAVRRRKSIAWYLVGLALGVCAVGRLAPRKTGDVLPKVQPGIPDGISGNGRFQIPASARFSIVRVRVLSRFPGINPPVAFASA